MEMSSEINALMGGALIGLSAGMFLWLNGRILGVSGIVGGLLTPKPKDIAWRVLFVLGVLIGGFVIQEIGFSINKESFSRGIWSAIVGGLLVGVGTTLGNGCTSGHGVCGISRFSIRSIIATMAFMITGMATASLFGLFG